MSGNYQHFEYVIKWINDSGLETVVVFAAEQYQMIWIFLHCDVIYWYFLLNWNCVKNFQRKQILITGNSWKPGTQ